MAILQLRSRKSVPCTWFWLAEVRVQVQLTMLTAYKVSSSSDTDESHRNIHTTDLNFPCIFLHIAA